MKKHFVILLVLASCLYSFKSPLIVDWVGNMFPTSGSSNTLPNGDDFTVYIQVYKAGVTEPAGQGSGINCEIYYGKVPAFGQPWDITYTQAMTYNVDIGNNDEYQGTISPPTGFYEFTCRCSDDGGATWTWATLPSGNGMLTVDSPLPLEMSFFHAEAFSNTVKLEWETSLEIDNNHFEIERSVDSRKWEMIGIIDGNGDSHEKINYQFTDKYPIQGSNYYRLKQVDSNGEFSYSSIVNVNFKTLIKSSIFPNPTENTLIIQHANNQAFSTELVSINNKGFKSYKLNGSRTELDLSFVPKGVYVLRIKDQNGYVIERHKIVKL